MVTMVIPALLPKLDLLRRGGGGCDRLLIRFGSIKLACQACQLWVTD